MHDPVREPAAFPRCSVCEQLKAGERPSARWVRQGHHHTTVKQQQMNSEEEQTRATRAEQKGEEEAGN